MGAFQHETPRFIKDVAPRDSLHGAQTSKRMQRQGKQIKMKSGTKIKQSSSCSSVFILIKNNYMDQLSIQRTSTI
jgi:hypothetical protein